MSESEYSLGESVKKLGRLVPIIKDAHGNIIDGFHRKAFDPRWEEEFSVTLGHITDPVQLLIARMNINTQRRTVGPEEKTRWLEKLVALTHWTPEQIAEHSGMSKRWVLQYMPKELKQAEPEELQRARLAREKMSEMPKEAQIEETKSQEIIHPIRECTRCHMASRETTEYKGETLCPSCLAEAKTEPIKKPVEPTPITTAVIKPKESWTQRKATMQVPVSKMEEAVLVKLEQKGLHPEVQKTFCLQQTRPDFYFPQQNVAIYLDGQVHQGREDRDEALRELLTKRYGVRVVTVKYEGTSEAAEDQIVKEITTCIENRDHTVAPLEG